MANSKNVKPEVEETKQVEETVDTLKESPTTEEQVDSNLEKVRVTFPKIRGNKNPDIVIMVNGKAWQIKRGVTVEVPKYVLKAYDNNERNREAAEAYIIEQTQSAS